MIREGLAFADQDSVRLLAVECCGPLAQLCNKDDVVSNILPVVQKFSQVSLGLQPLLAIPGLVVVASRDHTGQGQ